MQFDVDVDIHATVRVKAETEDEALDKAESAVQRSVIGLNADVHSVFPISASEV